jgi:hypothetical protein
MTGEQSSNPMRTMVPLRNRSLGFVMGHRISLECRDIARGYQVSDKLLQRIGLTKDQDQKVHFGLSSTLIEMRLFQCKYS